MLTKVLGQIFHNNYTLNFESNSIVLFGAKDCTVCMALSLEPRPSLTGAFTSRIVILGPSIVQLYFFALPKKVNKKR